VQCPPLAPTARRESPFLFHNKIKKVATPNLKEKKQQNWHQIRRNLLFKY
jgi:hypothetical protein